MSVSEIALIVAGVILLLIVIKIFFSPMRFIVKAVFNTIAGFLWLAIINFFGTPYGISLGFNLFNAIIIGIFGMPGTALLLLSKWAMM